MKGHEGVVSSAGKAVKQKCPKCMPFLTCSKAIQPSNARGRSLLFYSNFFLFLNTYSNVISVIHTTTISSVNVLLKLKINNRNHLKPTHLTNLHIKKLCRRALRARALLCFAERWWGPLDVWLGGFVAHHCQQNVDTSTPSLAFCRTSRKLTPPSNPHPPFLSHIHTHKGNILPSGCSSGGWGVIWLGMGNNKEAPLAILMYIPSSQFIRWSLWISGGKSNTANDSVAVSFICPSAWPHLVSLQTATVLGQKASVCCHTDTSVCMCVFILSLVGWGSEW